MKILNQNSKLYLTVLILFIFFMTVFYGCGGGGGGGTTSSVGIITPTSTPAAGSLSGVIYDESGRPIGGALVVLYTNTARVLHVADTYSADLTGRYMFSNVGAGVYRLSMWTSQDRYNMFPDSPDAGDNIVVSASETSVVNLTNGVVTPVATPIPEPTGTPTPAPIVFTRNIGTDDSPHYQVYTITLDGTGEKNLTNSIYQDSYPSLSYDGSTVLYQHRTPPAFPVPERYYIYSISISGTNAQQYITMPACTIVDLVTWEIVPFYNSEYFPNYTTNASSGPQVFLSTYGVTEGPTNIGFAFYTLYKGYIKQVWLRKTDGTLIRLHNDYPGYDAFYDLDSYEIIWFDDFKNEDLTPSISYSAAEGRLKILYASNYKADLEVAFDNHAIFICNGDENFPIDPSDPTKVTKLTDNDVEYLNPTLNPEGTLIAYAREDGSNDAGKTYDIWYMNVDGTNKVNITNSPNIDDSNPFFLPNGLCVFSSNRTGQYKIYTMDQSGGNLTLVTTGLHPKMLDNNAHLNVPTIKNKINPEVIKKIKTK